MKGRGIERVWLGWATACREKRKERREAGLGRVLTGCVSREEEEMGGGSAACWPK
jgi:hypothetical protein